MPALTISTSQAPREASSTSESQVADRRSKSPERPEISPITPIFTPRGFHTFESEYTADTTLQSTPTRQGSFPNGEAHNSQERIQRPAPTAFEEEENADAIALRSAITILQIQRDRCKADIRTLAETKGMAMREPQRFMDNMKSGVAPSGNVQASKKGQSNGMKVETGLEQDEKMDIEMEDEQSDGNDSGDDLAEDTNKSASTFPAIPRPQNIVRCPPINWAKYHIVGESLDKLHKEQVARPFQGVPERDGPATPESIGGRASVAKVAAPYTPATDGIVPFEMKTRNQGRKASRTEM
jgi:hypothetical protein